MKRLACLCFITLFVAIPSVFSQRVGVVLSGGGAKGVAHIGMLQALEENGIPIDYIAGTSMGAIVGGFYAMGYSPSDLLNLVRSPEFIKWMNGTVEEEYVDYFRQTLPTPEFLSTEISLKDTALKPGKLLPTSLMNPIQMNFAFLQLCAQATAQCGGDFNRLFVPFRCVAADVYHRRPYIFRNGDLGDAIRASMTFPLVFKAIRVDGQLLYDGGIYNNYPVDVMEKDFNPDVILGSVVVSPPEKPDDYDMIAQIQTMVMHPSNYSIPNEKGFQLNFNLSGVTLLDFHKADSIYRLGYEGTLAKIDSIKALISRRIDPKAVQLKRYLYRSHTPVLRFREIEIRGVNEVQQQYILRILKQTGENYFTLEDFKVGYFKLLADKKFVEIIPHAVYNPVDESFKLILDVTLNDNIALSIGGNISSTTANQLYLGIGFRILDDYSQHYTADIHVGRVLNALYLKSAIYTSGKIPQSFTTEFATLNYNFFQENKLFYTTDYSSPFIKQYETFLKFKYSLPFVHNGKVDFGFGMGYLNDQYMQNKLKTYTSQSFDKSIYALLNGLVRLEKNNLTPRQYPTEGQHRFLIGQYLNGLESYRYPDSVGKLFKTDKSLRYYQLSGGFEEYNAKNKRFILGTKGEFIFNTKRVLDNYTSA
jgi:NTE family protein